MELQPTTGFPVVLAGMISTGFLGPLKNGAALFFGAVPPNI